MIAKNGFDALYQMLTSSCLNLRQARYIGCPSLTDLNVACVQGIRKDVGKQLMSLETIVKKVNKAQDEAIQARDEAILVQTSMDEAFHNQSGIDGFAFGNDLTNTSRADMFLSLCLGGMFQNIM